MGGIGQKSRKRGFFCIFTMGKTKKAKGEKLSASPRKTTKTKINSENIKKRLTYFFNCDILYIVKGNESHEKHKGQAIREN